MDYKANRRNKNRGYQKLRVWEDAIELYRMTHKSTQGWSFEEKKTASQAISSADSVHRNIAEGYGRRSIREYLQFLNFALGSLAECVSGYVAYRTSKQLSEDHFEELDALAYRLENGLLKLVESLERKRDTGDWDDSLVVREANALYLTSTEFV